MKRMLFNATQAEELRTPGGGFGLHEVFTWLADRLVGVLNGIDQRTWDPAADEAAGNQCKSYGAAAIMRATSCRTSAISSPAAPRRAPAAT